ATHHHLRNLNSGKIQVSIGATTILPRGGIERPRRRIRATSAASRPRAIGSQVFIPVLRALFISGQRATKTVTATRAESDAVLWQHKIRFVFRRRLRFERIPRHTQRPRIGRIKRAAFSGRDVLHASIDTCRIRIITNNSTTFRTKHIGTNRTIGQRIAARRIDSRNRKRTRKRGSGRKTEGMIHQRSKSGDVH
ncbi:hypothetical protein, partial [Burkholderia stabilis]|uniref:hypothetical protein n=1 Tax=Burkholderia stabilis TaxID=95485 RepID=UPI001ABB79BC